MPVDEPIDPAGNAARAAASDAARLAAAAVEIVEWRDLWREFRKLQGAGNTPEIRNRLRELLRQGDALVLRA